MINAVGAVRQTKYSRFGEADGGRATDYDVTQHRLLSYKFTAAHAVKACCTVT